MNQRQLTTILNLLRHEANDQRKKHGVFVTTDGIFLTPDEMDEWATELEGEYSECECGHSLKYHVPNKIRQEAGYHLCWIVGCECDKWRLKV